MSATQTQFDARLDLIPAEPGVYLMKDTSGSVIYVGKAKNLPKRLASYFRPNPSGNAKVLAMISHIADFETIVCTSELEALILENSLIKEYQPRYNILLRDDREYPYIRVTLQEAYPRVLKAFHVGKDQAEGARYFGPYLAGNLKEALDAMGHIFPMKSCRRVFPRDIGKERPCLNYHIKRCIAPCLGTVREEDYRALILKICRFLDGRSQEILRELEQEMAAASERLDFEQAAVLRDRLLALKRLLSRQEIVDPEFKPNLDLIGLARNNSEICLQILKMREGQIVSSGSFFFEEQNDSPESIVEAFILQHYGEGVEAPEEILCPALPDNCELIESYLREFSKRKIQLSAPKRGRKLNLMKMAEQNAKESLRRHTLMGGRAEGLSETLTRLMELCSMTVFPERIEAYDISNTGSDDKAASMVVFQNGRPERNQYRHFRIRTVIGTDDYASMQEVLERRLRGQDQDKYKRLPDLILLDGGKGHLQTLLPQVQDLAPGLAVAAMIKDERHRTRGLVTAGGQIIELQAPSGSESPEERALRQGMLRLITAIQDEAHRFAGRLNRKLMKQRNLRYSLEDISGVGEARRRLLMKAFKSIKAISEASLEEIRQVQGLPPAVADAVYKHFHGEG